MIYDASSLAGLTLDADLCVVGSGAGGMTAAMVAAEAGLRVVVLEAGGFVPPDEMTQREEQMLPQLLLANGGQTTMDKGVHIHQGRAVGGSTVHNINLVKRIPDLVREHWTASRGLRYLPAERWDEIYRRAEALIRVNAVPASLRNRHNRILQAGCEALGWEGGGLRHNRTGCIGSGFCELGCAYDAKNNAAKICLPRAVAAGAQILSHCQGIRVQHHDGQVLGVEAAVLHPQRRLPLGRLKVRAPRVCLSASATGTPALLQRSGLRDPANETGRSLRVHPALVAAGDFEQPVRAWAGIPQTYECTEHLRFDHRGHRTWIVPAFAHPVGTATLLPGRAATHHKMMARYDHLAVLTGMVHDTTKGTVRPRGELGVAIDYWPNAADRRELVFGMAACARLLFAGGASHVAIPTDPLTVLTHPRQLDDLERLELTRGLLDITAVHPMGSVPMGDDPRGAVDSRGAHHHVRGLWLADGSLFPTSIGVPPQLSIYAMGLHVGEWIARVG